MKKIQISPSILSADFSQLGNEIKKLGAIRPLPHEYNTLRLDYIDKIDVKNPKVIHHTGKKGNEVIKEQINA